MPRNSGEQSVKIEKFTPGLHRGNYLNIVPFNQFRQFENVVASGANGYRKRSGITTYPTTNTVWTGSETELTDYINSANARFMVYRVDNDLYSYDMASTKQNVKTWGTAPDHVNYEHYKGELIICADNSSPQRWSGGAATAAINNCPAGNWPYVATFRSSLFLGKYDSANGRVQIRFSDPDDATTWGAANEINVPTFGGCTGLLSAHDRLYIFTEAEVWALIGDPDNWVLRRVSDKGGHFYLSRNNCQNPVRSPYGIIVAQPKELSLFDGTNFATLGKLQPYWPPVYYYADEAYDYAGTKFSYVYLGSKLYLSYHNVSYPGSSRMIVYDFQEGQWASVDLSGVTGGNGMIGGLCASTLTQELMVMAGKAGGNVACGYMNTDEDTHVAQDNLEGTDYDITDEIISGFFYVGRATKFKRVYVDYTAYVNNATSILVDVYLDGDYTTKVDTITLTVGAVSVTTRERQVARIETQGKSIALGIRTNNTYPVQVHEVELIFEEIKAHHSS